MRTCGAGTLALDLRGPLGVANSIACWRWWQWEGFEVFEARVPPAAEVLCSMRGCVGICVMGMWVGV